MIEDHLKKTKKNRGETKSEEESITKKKKIKTRQKKREKIDKNDTFILPDRFVNHIVAKNQQQLL